MEIAAYFSLILILSFLLVKSAELIEEAFVLVAKRVGISPFLIGFFVIATMSSLPEASVAVSSAIDQAPQLSVGNLLGASFTLMTLVVGLNAIKHKEIPFNGKFGIMQVLASVVVLMLQVIVLIDGQLTFSEGLILLGGYAVFIIYMFKHLTTHKKLHEKAPIEAGVIGRLMLKGVVGLLGLIFLSKFTVDTAVQLADLLEIPKSLIGVLVLGIGTNLPEITILFTSKTKAATNLAVGNFLGSATLNTGIMGFLAIIAPHQFNSIYVLIVPLIFTGVGLAIFGYISLTGKKITAKEAYLLVSIYAIFVVAQILEILIF
jgi:cation:H+ antiporter